MAPHEMAILEKWFTGKLMGKVEKPTKTSKRRKDTESQVATRGQLLDSIRSQSGMSNLKKVSPRPSTRSSMVDSDVEAPRSDVTKPQPSPLCDLPSRPRTPLPPIERVQLDNDVVSDDDVVHNSINDVSETEATMYKDNQTTDDDVTNDVTHDSSNDVSEIEGTMYKDNPTSSIMDTLALPKSDDADEAMSSNTSSVDVIEWKDGESYDSDEYEVVEIEVSESEDEEEGEEESLSSDENEEKGKKTDPVSALDNLGIFSNYEKMISSPKSAAKPGKLNIEEAQETPSLSLSPGTPRPVRDDDSWIAG
uniref:WH2 domain-containing protein n=1 Tax=Ciona savignyi TaxID=51511 RepID=H2ZBW0_CIOSA